MSGREEGKGQQAAGFVVRGAKRPWKGVLCVQSFVRQRSMIKEQRCLGEVNRAESGKEEIWGKHRTKAVSHGSCSGCGGCCGAEVSCDSFVCVGSAVHVC